MAAVAFLILRKRRTQKQAGNYDGNNQYTTFYDPKLSPGWQAGAHQGPEGVLQPTKYVYASELQAPVHEMSGSADPHELPSRGQL
jgi:hypothetical protein